MCAVRSIAKLRAVAIAICLIATSALQVAFGGDTAPHTADRYLMAQTSMGLPDLEPQPTPPKLDPRMNYIPPSLRPSPDQSSPSQPSQSADLLWGAIAFTADGSYASIWKISSKPEAEAKVAVKCAEYGRGSCKVVSFSGRECVGLARFVGSYKRRRWNLAFTAGGMTYPEAQSAAVASCNSDERSQGRCEPRIAACADGR
jgi:hypothetical protein